MKEWRDVLLCLRQKTAYELRISDWSSDVCSTDLHRAANRIPQQARTYASPLILQRHRQSCQNHHWQRILPHPLAHAIPCIQRIDLTDGQAEVARHAVIALGNDEGLGRAAALRLAGVAHEPVVQRRLAALKAIQPMLCGQGLRGAQRHLASQGAWRVNKSAK